MKSNYKRLGDFIQLVDERNRDLSVKTLLGISINKGFIPSVANTIGANMANYKIIRKDQFGCSLMQVRRDKKMPVGLLQEYDKAIISQAYPVFEIKDKELLLPEYLMMWLSRSEFDRHACFLAVGGVRGSLEWEDFIDTELPIPSIQKQHEIVKEYNTIVNRIKLNEQLNQKLEETAQAIYKHWFVDFEFPDENGEPYKSNGGKMFWCEEMGKDVPVGWNVAGFEQIIEMHDSKRVPLSSNQRAEMKGKIPYYGAASLMDYVNDYIFDGTYVLLGEDGTVINKDRSPVLQFVWGLFWVNNHAHVITGKKEISAEFIYLKLKNADVSGIITGGVQAKISQTNLKNLKTIIPNNSIIKLLDKIILPLFKKLKNNSEQVENLVKLKETLLSKM